MQKYYIIKYSSTSKNSLAFESINLRREDTSTYTPVGITGEVAFWCKDNNGQRYYLKPLNTESLDLLSKQSKRRVSNIKISGINELVTSPIYDLILNRLNDKYTVASKAILVCDSNGLLYTASQELPKYFRIDSYKSKVLNTVKSQNEQKINLIKAKITVLQNLVKPLQLTNQMYVSDIIKHPQIGWWNIINQYIVEAINFVLKLLFKIHRYYKIKLGDKLYTKYKDLKQADVEQKITKKTNRIHELSYALKWWNIKYMLHIAIVSVCCGKNDFLNNIGLSGNPDQECHAVTIDHGMTQGCAIQHLWSIIFYEIYVKSLSDEFRKEVLTTREADTSEKVLIIKSLREAITDIITQYERVKEECKQEIDQKIQLLQNFVVDEEQLKRLALTNLELFNNEISTLTTILNADNPFKKVQQGLYSLPQSSWNRFVGKIEYVTPQIIKELLNASLDQSNIKNQSCSPVR